MISGGKYIVTDEKYKTRVSCDKVSVLIQLSVIISVRTTYAALWKWNRFQAE